MIEQMDQELKIIFINILRENQMHIQQHKWKGFNEDTVYANGGREKEPRRLLIKETCYQEQKLTRRL